jgi:hypothetical protein
VSALLDRIRDSELSAHLARFRRMKFSEPQVREWLIRWGFRFGFVLLGVLSIYEFARG